MTRMVLKVGQKYDIYELAARFLDYGYERVEEINVPASYAISGGILSVFSTGMVEPVRIDFFGKEIDSINSFYLVSGQKREKLNEVEIKSNLLILTDGSKIKPSEYIVHEDYGIGLFKNFGLKVVEGEPREYIFIEYLNGDILYVPSETREKLSPYIGVGHRKPKLSRLGSQSWQRTYQKTYENVILLARELLGIYALRTITRRQPWNIDECWNDEMVASFNYLDTDDQAKAIEEVFSDLQQDVPMDRLISGDVGFGKTEVAIRAMAQAVANGYQVVMLVPTTILVEQHYINLKKRFDKLPVKIDHLSRFVGTADQKRIVEEVRSGATDILIGTHRLLGEDIGFKKLGLYVIDEEQRFGVKQKEKLKKIREEVNVLAMSATPIPRTLFMSLSGIRDISQINTPPKDRKEILTEISKYDQELINSYIDREIERGGQIYYLHNEVATIAGKQQQLKRIFPKLRIDIAHGQMGEEKLAETMGSFTAGAIDLLVCSTIIENGLDLPNANTLIVEESDKFGLSQLYQIRGRIGRSSKQAYALFTYSDKKLTDNAIKRLKSLAENTELGSGYNIALSDLEIRGGGNILGREQHGSMEAVGLILYSKLLKAAVSRLQNKRN